MPMYFVVPDRPTPLPINPANYRHVQFSFTEFKGEIAVRMRADEPAYRINVAGDCDCDFFASHGTCVHAQLANLKLTRPELFVEKL